MGELEQYKSEFLKAYDEYADQIFRFCYFRVSDRDVAEDLVQETFLRTWHYGIKGNEIKDVRAFLYQAARNLIIDYYRKSKSDSLDSLLEEGAQFEHIESSESPDLSTDHEYTLEKITDVIKELKDIHKEVLILRYIEGYGPKEIAKMLQLTENTISVRLHRAVNELREKLDNKNEHDA